ncbi:hypothetical protein NEOLEDRAFT_1129796 [Neolentinus lepideus HHB14362 ss-1]|uniref:Uncharacterized protein n=1 Tax=Neolentinus lepideus HHB14362 ss-1 TaxID=1314782 RepID=A0A165UMC9_9AGAM|nr:hypothetical protein NEOLEDRAFT_1129796 [Neolentinus lepideus HHB14362 ss-1]
MYAVLLALAAFASALGVQEPIIDSEGRVEYFNPNLNGGSMLDNVGGGLGEPLNVIISGTSSPSVLTDDGVLNFARAIGFSEECFDIHLGAPQTANLGDGKGWTNQLIEFRQDYGNDGIGTCLESLIGGNHFRVWRQNGTLANSGALFFAVSKEEPLTEEHDVIPNGYNIGRDLLVSAALGDTEFYSVKYRTRARNITGLLAPGDTGVNHNISTDGIVTLLTVTIL